MADGQVEVVDSFVYLGSTIDSTGDSRGEILHWIGLARSCMNLLEKNWKSSIRLNTKLHLYQSSSLAVRLWNVVHNEVPLRSHRCVWHVGYSEDPIMPAIWPILKSDTSLVASLSHHNRQKIVPLWPHHPQITKWRSPPFSRISNPKASLGLEATERKTQWYLATCNWRGFEATEYWPLVCMEEGNQPGDLAISGGQGNA